MPFHVSPFLRFRCDDGTASAEDDTGITFQSPEPDSGVLRFDDQRKSTFQIDQE
jgi:hypothetical protein